MDGNEEAIAANSRWTFARQLSTHFPRRSLVVGYLSNAWSGSVVYVSSFRRNPSVSGICDGGDDFCLRMILSWSCSRSDLQSFGSFPPARALHCHHDVDRVAHQDFFFRLGINSGGIPCTEANLLFQYMREDSYLIDGFAVRIAGVVYQEIRYSA